MNTIGYFHGNDPAACLVRDGEVVAFVEEERLIRFKHAEGIFPIRAIAFCLSQGGLRLEDVDRFVYGWDGPRYSDPTSQGMASFYERLNGKYPPDSGTRAWQRRNLSWFRAERVESRLRAELVRFFGIEPGKIPPLVFHPHHETHAAAGFYLSDLEEALVLVLDGSGDSDCTTLWRGEGVSLEPLERIEIPHSLGWFYAALTEYLGFQAYDGEYKVMGLAAYGRDNVEMREQLGRVVAIGPRGYDYVLDPRFIHHGPHSYSHRFTDHLVELLGLPPRLGGRPLEQTHHDLAFETQRALETAVLRLLSHFRQSTGMKNLCISGGVGLNVKLNSRIRESGLFDRVSAFPIPSDSGLGVGAAVALDVAEIGKRPAPLRHVFLGPSYEDDQIETQIRSCGYIYRTCDDVAEEAAELLEKGKVVAWFQGALEAGPRALGGRSILADPRTVDSRERVNSAIKFREYWRPFCPSMTEKSAERFLENAEAAPFMIMAFEASDEAREKIPGVVHVDGTVRVQTVDHASNPLYHRLLEAFERRTGVAVVLNTSFNIKGEAIVASPRDAFRTFWSTGIDALAIGSFLIEKPESPLPTRPEEVIR
ncbi:MAG: nodulation protein [Acidobacteriota bacterium]|nr:nodulation protein [Acidobacteriota bacterium]